MPEKDFSHIDSSGKPKMVDISEKSVTYREAVASAIVELPFDFREYESNNDINSPKGPVFQTAIIAGTQAVKNTSLLIPFCHTIAIEKCKFTITPSKGDPHIINITCKVSTEGKTGVEMEAITGASVAAITIYDMCKALSHDIKIKEVKLMKKSGGKNDFIRE